MSCASEIISEDYADFILDYYFYVQYVYQTDYTNCVNMIGNQYAVIHIPLSEAQPITIEAHSYPSIPKLFTILDTTSLEAAGILPVLNQPYLNARGQQTMIGFIDTGIDYQNPLFQNPDGTTRILSLWDQTIQPEEPVDKMIQEYVPYGTQYSSETINQALQSEDPLSIVPSRDENGHGTFIAGIAAGREAPEADFSGAAPDCSIAMVKLKPAKQYLRDFYLIDEDAIAYQEDDIMLAIKYLMQISTINNLPLVICISLGTNSGNHDGTSPLGEYLNAISNIPGIITVVAAGNETGYSHHYHGTLPAEQEYQDVELRVAAGGKGLSLEFWANGPELFSVGFISPTGEIIAKLPSVPPGDRRVTFTLERTVITVSYQIADIGIGSQLIFMRFEDPTPGIWRIRVYNSVFLTGEYHMWLPIHTFLPEGTIFLRPSPDTTITEPGNARIPLTVSTYDHRDNSLYIHSSRGYTRLGSVTPDLAAPGVSAQGPSLTPPTDSNPYPMTNRTGSSIAAAYMAGACADLLSWALVGKNNLAMNTSIAKTYLIRGATRSAAYTYPNREWGFGTLNLYNSFLQLRNE